MKFYQIFCEVYLKKDIHFLDSFDILSKFISFSLCQNEDYEKLHNENKFKNYCFSTISPPQKDKIYKKGNIYSFILRSLDKGFIEDLSIKLRENINNPYLQVLKTEFKTMNQFFINELYSIPPCIVTSEVREGRPVYWTVEKDGDILKLAKQLQDNLEKKYKSFYGEELKSKQNFIQLLEIKNQKPQSIFFMKEIKDNKKIKLRLFGNKFQIVVNEDKVSQKLAFMALACGIGEKNSLGGGYLGWK